MKHLLTLFALVAGLSLSAQAQKFGHIDAQQLLLNLPERADAQVQIESAAKEYETEMVRMQTELQTKYGEYQEKAATWPDAIRQQKERELQTLDAGLQEFAQTVQLDLSTMEESLLTPMIQRVQQAIEEVGKEHGFTYIFDSSMGATLYNGGEDVSSLVKTKLGL
jgi:outer membrane protein